jgi:hypothetical protein
LGLLDGRGLPVAAGWTASEVLVDSGGGDGFAFPVDPCRQRLTRDVASYAVHVSIVAHRGWFVPAIPRHYPSGTVSEGFYGEPGHENEDEDRVPAHVRGVKPAVAVPADQAGGEENRMLTQPGKKSGPDVKMTGTPLLPRGVGRR